MVHNRLPKWSHAFILNLMSDDVVTERIVSFGSIHFLKEGVDRLLSETKGLQNCSDVRKVSTSTKRFYSFEIPWYTTMTKTNILYKNLFDKQLKSSNFS